MELASLLGLASLDYFIERHFLQIPFVVQGGCERLTRDFGWNAVTRLLECTELDWLVTREGEVVGRERPPTAGEAAELLGAGHALRFRHAERLSPEFATLAAAFRNTFHSPVDCHVYCTGANSVGLQWHYDAEDLFVLQTEGSKEWRLRKNTVHPWPLVETLPHDMQFERETMPTIYCRLAAGDWLYIPGGYWHCTRSDEKSISLSIGVLPCTALDVLDYVRQQLPSELLWRQRLPPLIAGSAATDDESQADWRRVFKSLAVDLARRLGDEQLIDAFLKHRRTGE
jgi:ribosomal protein L16 Arg81 hydroxylase